MTQEEPITYLHRHEMMDRSYAVLTMLDSLIVEHRAAEALQTEIQAAHEALYRLYQRAGELAFTAEVQP